MKPLSDSTPTSPAELELPDASWSMGDLIDYQICLEDDHRKASDSHEDLRLRERVLNRAQVSKQAQSARLADHVPTRRKLFLAWVQTLRHPMDSTHEELDSVGETTEQAANALTWLAIGLAILSAVGVGSALVGALDPAPIATEDRPYRPLDILHSLGFGLVPQVIMIVLSVIASFSRKANINFPRPVQGIFILGLRLYTSFIQWMRGHTDVDGATRSIKAQLGKAVGRLISRREVFSAALIHRLQKVAFAYSLTLLVVVVASFTVNARSFGWQSSLNLSPEFIHRVTSSMAKPWRAWAPEGNGSPTLEQIRQTEFSEIKGFSEAEKAASQPWIHFLLYSLLFYAVIPRLLLLILTRLWEKSTLAKLEFSDVNDNTLFRRLKAPPLIVAPVQEAPELQAELLPVVPPVAAVPSMPTGTVSRDAAVLLLTDTPAEAVESVAQALAPVLEKLHGWKIHHARRVYSVAEQAQAKEDFAALQWEDSRPRLVVVRRANHLVMSVKSLVEALLNRGGPQTQLVLLIGGAPDLLEDPVADIHAEAWQAYANELKLHHPHVVVERLSSAS